MASVPLPTDPEPEREPDRADPAAPGGMTALPTVLLALLLCGRPGTGQGHPCSERGQLSAASGGLGVPGLGAGRGMGRRGRGWSLRPEGGGRGSPDPTSLKGRLQGSLPVPPQCPFLSNKQGLRRGGGNRCWKGQAPTASDRQNWQGHQLGAHGEDRVGRRRRRGRRAGQAGTQHWAPGQPWGFTGVPVWHRTGRAQDKEEEDDDADFGLDGYDDDDDDEEEEAASVNAGGRGQGAHPPRAQAPTPLWQHRPSLRL